MEGRGGREGVEVEEELVGWGGGTWRIRRGEGKEGAKHQALVYDILPFGGECRKAILGV